MLALVVEFFRVLSGLLFITYEVPGIALGAAVSFALVAVAAVG